MSVPAHTHNDLHPCPLNQPDYYENQMGGVWNASASSCEDDPGGIYPAQNWNQSTAFAQGSILESIFCKSDFNAMRHLFYTQNQVADFFPSGVNPSSSSEFIPGDKTADLTNSDLAQIYSTLPSGSPQEINVNQIANTSFNFAIRTTATLFHWFALKTGMIKTTFPAPTLSQPNLSLCVGTSSQVYISSPKPHETYTWSPMGNTRVNGGSSPVQGTSATISGNGYVRVTTINNSCATVAPYDLYVKFPPLSSDINIKEVDGTCAYQLANLPAGATVSWSAQGMSIVGSATSNVVTLNNYNGFVDGTLVATVTTSCGSYTYSKTFHDIQGVKIDHEATCENGGVRPGFNYTFSIPTDNLDVVKEYVWSVPPDFTIHSGQGTSSIVISAPYQPFDSEISVDQRLRCGLWVSRIALIPPTESPCCPFYDPYCDHPYDDFAIMPNPADEFVEIKEIKVKENLNGKIKKNDVEIIIYDNLSQKVWNGKLSEGGLKIETRKFKNGFYYIHIIGNGEIKRQTLIISH